MNRRAEAKPTAPDNRNHAVDGSGVEDDGMLAAVMEKLENVTAVLSWELRLFCSTKPMALNVAVSVSEKSKVEPLR